jgi:hypothetical protein
MGIAAAVRRTDGGRRPEATRSVTAIRLELGDGHLPDKARRAFVFEGHSYAFARQAAFTEATAGRTARVRTNGSAQTCYLRCFGTPTSVGHLQRQLRHAARATRSSFPAGIKPSPAQTCRAGLKRQKIGPRDQVGLSIRSYFGFTTQRLRRRGKVGLNIELGDLDHRVIGEALVERMGHLIELVEDTTRTTSARRAASRELRLLMSVLCKLIDRATGPPN